MDGSDSRRFDHHGQTFGTVMDEGRRPPTANLEDRYKISFNSHHTYIIPRINDVQTTIS